MVFLAKTGSASFAWTKVKPLFLSKLEHVIVDFSNVSPIDEVPPVPNVVVFNFSGKDESQELIFHFTLQYLKPKCDNVKIS